MSLRCKEPGWILCAMNDPMRRRGIWYRVINEGIEVCAGREGDDSYAFIPHPYADDLEKCLSRGAVMAEHIEKDHVDATRAWALAAAWSDAQRRHEQPRDSGSPREENGRPHRARVGDENAAPNGTSDEEVNMSDLGKELDDDVKRVVVGRLMTAEAVKLLHELQTARDFIDSVAAIDMAETPEWEDHDALSVAVGRAISLRALRGVK